ncbi:MAG TPA: zf-HC2 domain-containing protein [Ktedonobacterales bacterium]|nr:zf-HC2 domain-containing protein [Ktedonobacterales bacterium]
MEHHWEQQREQLSALLDNELGTEERAELKAHLATCAECRAELASLERARALLRALPQPTLPRSFALPLEAAPIHELPRQVGLTARQASQRPNAAPARRARSRRPAQVLQWISTIAALLGIIVLLSGVFTGHTFNTATTASSALTTGQNSSTSADQPGVTATPPPERTSTTHPAVPTTVPSAGGATSTPGTTPGSTYNQHDASNPDTGSSLGALISSAGFGVLLLLFSVCGFAIAWALRRRW